MIASELPEAEFVVPQTVEAAVAALGTPDALAVSGGTSIGLLIGQGLLAPTKLVWLGRIAELSDVDDAGGRLAIGAATTLATIARDARVRAIAPALADAAASVGNTRVRAVATIGGALAHADPRQDVPPALLALGAVVEVAGRRGRRRLTIDQLIDGFMSTSLEQDEVITAVHVPAREGRRSCYLRFTPGSVDDYPAVAVAATATVAGGAPADVTLAVGGAAPVPYLVPEAGALRGAPASQWDRLVEEAAGAAAQGADPVDDRLGSADYKRRMVAVWARRALEQVLGA